MSETVAYLQYFTCSHCFYQWTFEGPYILPLTRCIRCRTWTGPRNVQVRFIQVFGLIVSDVDVSFIRIF